MSAQPSEPIATQPVSARTPSPWRVVYGGGGTLLKGTNILGKDSDYVCLVGGDQDTAVEKSRLEDDAQFIVAACNNYERVCAERDELAILLDRAVLNIEDIFAQKDCAGDYCQTFNRGHGSHRALIDQALAALAKVRP